VNRFSIVYIQSIAEKYLIGKDTRRPAHHWQAMYRHAFYRYMAMKMGITDSNGRPSRYSENPDFIKGIVDQVAAVYFMVTMILWFHIARVDTCTNNCSL
jgi:hypothetical protein